jgi:hypothetical protein
MDVLSIFLFQALKVAVATPHQGIFFFFLEGSLLAVDSDVAKTLKVCKKSLLNVSMYLYEWEHAVA